MRWIVFVSAIFMATHAIAQDYPGGRLTVSGEGQVDSKPDMAIITMGAVAEARTAAQAMRQTSVVTADILALLGQAGVAARDMQTSSMSLSPVWDNPRESSPGGRPEITGYQASNTVTVRVRPLDELGSILDVVVENGANLFQGLSFGLQNPKPAQDEALQAAVVDAMRKAALYADAAGLTLGDVLELSETTGTRPMPFENMRMSAMAEAVPIAEGEVTSRAQVTMVFAVGAP